MSALTDVSVVKSSSYRETLYDNIKKAIELCGGLDLDNGDDIIIKINLCDFRPPETGAITHPMFLDAFLKYLRLNFRNLKIKVVESDATSTDADMFVKWFGFLPIINKWDAKWVNLSKTLLFKKEIPGRRFRTLLISEIFRHEHFFITMAKLKTHCITKISCALKNQFGCIPEKRKIKFHPFLDDVIVDANLAMPPDFCIVDGIIGLGGVRGPTWGPPINSKLIVAGSDPVAVDAVCAKIMGFSPYFISHIRKAEASGVGKIKHKILGENIGEIRADFCFNIPEWMLFRVGTFLQSRAKKRRVR